MIYYITGIWLICGFINYGFMFAFFQRKCPETAKDDYRKDMMFCMFCSLLGPSALFTSVTCNMFKHGFKLK